MRVVADTNTVLSAFLYGGVPYQAVRLFEGQNQHQLMVTEALLQELEDVLSRDKFVPAFRKIGLTPALIFIRYRLMTTLVQPAFVPEDAVSDPKDRKVLACAVGGQADVLITGDVKHLLKLRTYEKTAIVTAAEFLARFSGNFNDLTETDLSSSTSS